MYGKYVTGAVPVPHTYYQVVENTYLCNIIWSMKLNTIVVAVVSALAMIAPASASSLCSNTLDCTLELTQANSSSGFGTGNFGTVQLVGDGTSVVTITVSLNSGWDIIDTGFPGSFGFTDSLSGTPTIGNFSSSLYSGSTTDTTQDLHFDGFGFTNDAAATTGPHNGAGLQSVSFTVTQTGLTNVNDLLNLSGTPAGDGQVFFAVDAGVIGGSTGLLGVTGTAVPEPSSYAFLLAAFGAIIWIARRRQKLPTGSQA
jgi:hypothetical protein